MASGSWTPTTFRARLKETARGCWEWTGCLDGSGYGRTSLGNRPMSAHRASWTLARGPVPGRLLVLHHCDNPPCCRPDHLFLGDPGTNRFDSKLKGRAYGRVSPEPTPDECLQAYLLLALGADPEVVGLEILRTRWLPHVFHAARFAEFSLRFPQV